MWKILLMVLTNIVITLAFASAQTVYYGNIPNRSGEIVTYTDSRGAIAGNSFRSGNIVTFTDRNGAIAGNAIVTDLGPAPPAMDHVGEE